MKEGLLPSAKKTAVGWTEWLKPHLPEKTYDKLYRMMNDIPESNTMVHGDYHTNNVHYDNNEAILIDMDTLSVGNPIFEFASIFLAYRGFGELDPDNIQEFLMIDWDTAGYILEKLMDYYFDDKDEAYKTKVLDKAKTIGYTRILRRTIKRTPEKKKEIEHYYGKLLEYVDKVDSLAI